MSDRDRSLDCAEYVLGTLTAEERAEFAAALATDATLQAEVDRWTAWLAPLNDIVPAVTPPPELWAAIRRRIATPDAAAPTVVRLPERPARPDLSASRARWRAAAVFLGAVAAVLAVLLVRPILTPPGATYLAVVDRGGSLPALLVYVDTRQDTVSVRSVAAEVPPGRSLELWYIAGNAAPRPVGLLDRPDTRLALPPGARGDDPASVTLAVSVEPPGGSTTGAPTGPVVYTGKLFREQ